MIEQVLKFLSTPTGRIIVRLVIVMLVGSVGVNTFLRKIANVFGLLTKGEKRKRFIFALTDFVSIIATVFISILVSYEYRTPYQMDFDVYVSGLLYGFGAVGAYQFIIDGKLWDIIKKIRNTK